MTGRSGAETGRLRRGDRDHADRRRLVGRVACSMVLVACLTVLVAGCSSTGPIQVELAELADRQQAWHGRRVEVTGVVRTFEPPLHYWIEDARQNRVELVPPDGLGDLVGRPVTVRGRFTFREGEGRRIVIDRLVPGDVGA